VIRSCCWNLSCRCRKDLSSRPTTPRVEVAGEGFSYRSGVGRRSARRAEGAVFWTRSGRILFSFGNWIGVCADHSNRGCVPGCFVVNSRGRLIALGRRQMRYSSWWSVRAWDIGSGAFRGRLAVDGLGVKSSVEFDGGGVHGLPCAAAPLRHGGGRNVKAIYTSARMLKTGPKTCHFLPLFAERGGQLWRNLRTVCRIRTRGSGRSPASSGDAEKEWQRRAANGTGRHPCCSLSTRCVVEG
jgi:hypothetical protein